MLTAIRATYRHGQLIWHEIPPATADAEVVVTFLEKERVEIEKHPQNGIWFGSLKGLISTPPDFNEPLDDLSKYM
ncbi:MAG: DUF2281 domain-containing protein [Spirosoma sp.]|nr:DUF2281 domain-containing protein [Spirosoma sp.]